MSTGRHSTAMLAALVLAAAVVVAVRPGVHDGRPMRMATYHAAVFDDATRTLRVPGLSYSTHLAVEQRQHAAYREVRTSNPLPMEVDPRERCTHLVSHDNLAAAVVCNGTLRSGVLATAGQVWAIEADRGTGTVLAFNGSADPTEIAARVANKDTHAIRRRARRHARTSKIASVDAAAAAQADVAYIELRVISDESAFAAHGDDAVNVAAAAVHLSRVLFAAGDGMKPRIVPIMRTHVTVDTKGTFVVIPRDGDGEVDAHEYLERLRVAVDGVEEDMVSLLTYEPLADRKLGIAYVPGACDQGAKGSISSQDTGNAAADAAILTHEIGHNLGLPHDGSECEGFIMAATTDTNAPATSMSTCTAAHWATGHTDFDCLGEPTEAMCGDGFVSAGEECDTGSSDNTTCCEACVLVGDAQCEPLTDPCCTSECMLAAAGVVCRESTSVFCDPEERCTGSSSACPIDTTTCKSGDDGSGGLFRDGEERLFIILGPTLLAISAIGLCAHARTAMHGDHAKST